MSLFSLVLIAVGAVGVCDLGKVSDPSEPSAPHVDPVAATCRLFDTPGITVLNAALCLLGVLSLGASMVLVGLSYGDQSPFGSGESVPSFVLIFPLWGWMFVILNQAQGLGGRLLAGGRSWLQGGHVDRRASAPLVPRSVLIVAPVVLVVSGILGATSMSGLRGQPEYDPSRHGYVENDHGSLIPVTHANYVRAVATQNRLFLITAIAFTAIATVVSWGEWRRRRTLGSSRWPAPTTARPHWIPSITGGIAILVVGVVTVVFFAHIVIARLAEYQSEAPRLEPRGSTVVSLTSGDYVLFVGCTQSIVCPSVDPSSVKVRVAGGSGIRPTADPSNDHLTFNTEPYVGALSFRVPHGGRYTITTHSRGDPTLVVLHSPGQEALALIPWISGGVVGVVLAIYGVVLSLLWYGWRFSTQSPRLERPLGPPPILPPWPPQGILGRP
jgi:hypothetical protein